MVDPAVDTQLNDRRRVERLKHPETKPCSRSEAEVINAGMRDHDNNVYVSMKDLVAISSFQDGCCSSTHQCCHIYSLFGGIGKNKRKSKAKNASKKKKPDPGTKLNPQIEQLSSSLNARSPLRIRVNRNPLRVIRAGELKPILLMLQFLQLCHDSRTGIDTLDPLDLLAFLERHDSARPGNNAGARDEEAR